MPPSICFGYLPKLVCEGEYYPLDLASHCNSILQILEVQVKTIFQGDVSKQQDVQCWQLQAELCQL